MTDPRWTPSKSVRITMEKVLARLAAGDSIDAATAAAGRSRAAHYKWLEKSPWYVAEYERTKSRVAQNRKRPPCPFTADFREKAFGHIYPVKPITPPHMEELIDFFNAIRPGEAGVALVAPDHAKSSVCEDLITAAIADDPDLRAAIISKSQGEAKKRLMRVQRRLEDRDLYPYLHDEWGPFKPDVRRAWASTHFRVVGSTATERDWTLQALGVRGQLQGSRLDLGVLDDIADIQNQSPPEVEAQVEWIRDVVNTRIGNYGRLIFIGNRAAEADVYKVLMDEGFFDHVLILPAQRADGSYLWPERFAAEDYERFRRKAGARTWALKYQQDPISNEGAAFPLEAIESCYDRDRYIGQVPPGCRVVVGIDPAATGFTAGVALAYDPKTQLRHLIDVWNEKDLTGDGGDRVAGLVQFIVELCRKYEASDCCLEANSAWTLLSSSLSLRSQLSELGVRLRTVKSGKGENDDLAIEQLSSLFFNRLLTIPTKGDSKKHIAEFVNQFATWRAGDKRLVRDIVKAFQFAELEARAPRNPDPPKVTYPKSMPPYLIKRLRKRSGYVQNHEGKWIHTQTGRTA